MLKKMIISLTFCFAINQAFAQEVEQINSESQNGRYQLSVVTNKSNHNVKVFVLDTRTGTVWSTESGSFGHPSYTEWRRLPPFPAELPPFPEVEKTQ